MAHEVFSYPGRHKEDMADTGVTDGRRPCQSSPGFDAGSGKRFGSDPGGDLHRAKWRVVLSADPFLICADIVSAHGDSIYLRCRTATPDDTGDQVLSASYAVMANASFAVCGPKSFS
jgi:hypothetical protein